VLHQDIHLEDIYLDVQAADADPVVIIGGEIDMVTAPTLADALRQIDPRLDIVVDFAAVSFMDSSGLNVLIEHWQRADAAGGSLRVRHAGPAVRRIVDIAGLNALLAAVDQPVSGG
jgi:stage II sporulation protein AA (anti-sigma F factor antagonist)